MTLTCAQIEGIIEQELSFAEKTDNRYWHQPKLKKPTGKYNMMFGYIDTVTETIHFLIN